MELLLAFLAGAVLLGILAYLKIKQLTTSLGAAQTAHHEVELQNKELLAGQQMAMQKQADLEKFWKQLSQEQDNKFNALQKQAQDTFKQLADEVLKNKQEQLATHNIQTLYAPLKESFERFTKEIGVLRTESASYNTNLKNALDKTATLNEKLSKNAEDLATALKRPKTHGTWGEIILEDILRSASLREGEEFELQASFTDENGKHLYPDAIVHLPNHRDMVIDSKMSLNYYVEWTNATDEAQKKALLQKHVESVEAHIKELSEKNYPKILKNEKLDFTLMFIPIEHAYFAALQAYPDLHEFARRRHIYIVTPSNLLTVLQIAENLWRLEHSTQDIREIFQIARNMHERVGTFMQRMETIQDKIHALQGSYDDAITSLKGNRGILVSAKQLENLHVKSAKKLPRLAEEEHPALPQDKTL